jgi:N-methylhydantoinase B
MATRELSDPILLELTKNALDAIVEEMAIALVRTAYSNNLKNSMDMSCALCDADGRLIAQGLTLPLHLGSVPDAMAHIRRKFAGRIEPGDVFILNDPFDGGTHLPDFYIFKPIFRGGALVGWASSIGHQLDVGGKTPGGNGCDATEIFQEGLRIPPLKLYAAGRPVEALFELIDRNVRVPRQVLGDVRAQLAACETGERGYLGLLD